jgi:hypothetical protein
MIQDIINRISIYLMFILLSVGLSTTVKGQEGDAAAEMAKKLQDPLANITALMTDNELMFKTGNEQTSYSFQLQPVKAFSFDKIGINFIARGIIPILGMAPESQKANIGDPLPSSTDYTWGLGDIVTQFFFSPKTDKSTKWGVGPVLSWNTHTTPSLAGSGWGAGVTAVVVGGKNNISFAIIATQLWNYNGSFSTFAIQPMVFYNLTSLPGTSISYLAPISYDFKATDANAFTLPLGLSFSKVIVLGNKGHGLELLIGPYYNAIKPEGAAAWRVKWGINWALP